MSLLFGVTGSAVIVCSVVVGVQIGIGNNSAGTGCVDKLTITNVDTDVRQACLVCILEEDQIAGLQICLGNRCAFGIHGNLCTADVNAVAAEHIVHKTGAVKAAWVRAAPFVGDAQILLCSSNNLVPGCSTGGSGTGRTTGGRTGRRIRLI